MTLSIQCPNCGRLFTKIKPEFAGQKVRCSCGFTLRLPETLETIEVSSTNRPPTRPVAQKKQSPGASNFSEPVNAFELHYSDLDDILSQPAVADQDFDPTAQPSSKAAQSSPTKVRKRVIPESVDTSLAPQPVLSTPAPTQPAKKKARPIRLTSEKASHSSLGASVLAVLGLLSATTAFTFAMFLLSARLTKPNIIFDGNGDTVMRQIFSGQFGMEATQPSLKLGFQLIGWLIVLTIVGLLLLAAAQFANACLHLFSQLNLFRWVDGLMATITLVLVSLLIGTLFLHASHNRHLTRQLNQFAQSTDSADEPANIQQLRVQYRNEAASFRWGVGMLLLAPAVVFMLSMLRMMIRRDEAADSNSISGDQSARQAIKA